MAGQTTGHRGLGRTGRRVRVFLQNHDQVANQLWGDRLHHKVGPAVYRALTALLLLAPETPLLFMGQEFAASTPFLFLLTFRRGA